MTDDETRDRISGKVAEVISDREVILNRGSDHGVEPGMYFAILNPDTVGIPDPDTGEDLGGFRVVKVVVRAIEVAPKLTLARTFRTRTVNVGGTGSSILGMMNPPKYEEQVEKLTLDANAPRKIAPSESIVHVKDPFEESTREEAQDSRTVTLWETDDGFDALSTGG